MPVPSVILGDYLREILREEKAGNGDEPFVVAETLKVVGENLLGCVLQDEDARRVVQECLDEWLGKPWSKLVVIALPPVLGVFAQKGWAGLSSALGNAPYGKRFARILAKLNDRIENRLELKEHLRQVAAGRQPEHDVDPADLRTVQELAALAQDKQLREMQRSLQQTATKKDLEALQERYLALLQEKLSTKLESLHSARTSDGSEIGLFSFEELRSEEGFNRFRYAAARDEFVGRDRELDSLRKTLLAPPEQDRRMFLWHTVIGDAGVGKSRFAFELCRRVVDDWPISGLVPEPVLTQVLWRTWRPSAPTLLVVDYAAVRLPPEMLDTLANESRRFAHPVRLLLLGRSAHRVALERLCPEETDKSATRNARAGKGATELKSLSFDACRKIMRGRIRTAGQDPSHFQDAKLDDALMAVDPERHPLSAAMVGEELGKGTPIDDVGKSRTDLLNRVVRRERGVWLRLAVKRKGNHLDGERLLRSHEAVLCLATITRGFDRERLDELSRKRFKGFRFPADDELDEELYRRMSDQADTDTLAPLEPDLLGGFFVEKTFGFCARDDQTSGGLSRARQDLIDEAWRIDPVGSGLFATLAELDHGSADSDPTRYLPSPAILSPGAELTRHAARKAADLGRYHYFHAARAAPNTRWPWNSLEFDPNEEKVRTRQEAEKARMKAPVLDAG